MAQSSRVSTPRGGGTRTVNSKARVEFRGRKPADVGDSRNGFASGTRTTYTDELENRFERSLARREERGDPPLPRPALLGYRLHGCQPGKCERGPAKPLYNQIRMPVRTDCLLAKMLYPLMFRPAALLRRYGGGINADDRFRRALTTLRNLVSNQFEGSSFLHERISRGHSRDKTAKAAAASGVEAHLPDDSRVPLSELLLTPDEPSGLARLAKELLDEYEDEMSKAAADLSLLAKREVRKLRGEHVPTTGSEAQKASNARRRRG